MRRKPTRQGAMIVIALMVAVIAAAYFFGAH